MFKTLVEVLDKISKETRAVCKQKLLEQYFNTLSPEDIKAVIYIIDEQIPLKKQFAIGLKFITYLDDKTYHKMHSYICATWVQDIKNYPVIYATLKDFKGKNSRHMKLSLLSVILSYLESELEQAYFKRMIVNRLRIGLKNRLLLPVVSKYFNICFSQLQGRYNLNPSVYEVLDEILNNKPVCNMSPIKCMLVKNYKQSVFEKLKGTYVYEPKYDGMRCQIHFNEGQIKVYTRNLKDVSYSLSGHILKHLHTLKGAHILDAELCGLDFQTLTHIIMRKHDNMKFDNFFTQLHIFDYLYEDGVYLLNKSYQVRKNLLKNLLLKYNLENFYVSHEPLNMHTLTLAKSGDYVEEGIVLKQLYSTYKPNTRDNSWLKVKKDVLEGDFIVIAAYKGTGAYEIYYSSLLLACNSVKGIVHVGQLGSGLSEENLKFIKSYIFEQTNSEVMEPEYIFKRPFVINILYQDVQRSKTYNSGLSLRFPRFIKFRFDKSIEDAESWNI